MILDRQRVDRSECVELLAEHLRLLAQRCVVQLDGWKRTKHILERTSPLRLESFADRGPPARKLSEAHLDAMELIAHRAHGAPHFVEGVLGDRERLIGFTHRNLSGRKSNLAIGEGCLTSLEVEPPI